MTKYPTWNFLNHAQFYFRRVIVITVGYLKKKNFLKI